MYKEKLGCFPMFFAIYFIYFSFTQSLHTFVPLSQRQAQQKQISLPEHELKSKRKLRETFIRIVSCRQRRQKNRFVPSNKLFWSNDFQWVKRSEILMLHRCL